MQQQLILTVLGSHKPDILEKLTKALRDSGASIMDSRMITLGNEFSMIVQLSGTWDTIAKTEGILPKLEKQLAVKITSKRTGKRVSNNQRIPYAIEIVCKDRPGVVHDVVKFFIKGNIDIHDMYTSTYQTPHTDVTMFSMHMVVNIPADSSISSVRTEFMDFCDQLNLDAIMEPAK